MMDEFNRVDPTMLGLPVVTPEMTPEEKDARLQAMKAQMEAETTDAIKAELAELSRMERREALLDRREISRQQASRARQATRGRALPISPRHSVATRRV